MSILFFISMCIALRVSLRGHREMDCWVVRKVPLTSHCQVALKMMLSVYTPTLLNSACLPVSSPILGVIWYVCFVTWMGIIWYLTVTKICISLMTTEIEYHIIYWHLFRFLPSELLVPSCYGILPRFLTDLEEFVRFSGYLRVAGIFS